MIVYRIAQATYIDDLSGFGAFLYGGRWNPKGTHVLYTASTISLAYLEYLVHQFERDTWPMNLFISKILIENADDFIELNPADLPEKWRDIKYHGESQQVATTYFSQGVLGLKIPSVIVPEEQNILLNPLHPQFNELVSVIKKEQLALDKRFGLP